MIPSSYRVAVIAVFLAIATHGLALQDYSTSEPAQTEGSGSVEVAAFGSSFKDLVAGAAASAPPPSRHQAQPPQPTQPAEKQTLSPNANAPTLQGTTGASKVTAPRASNTHSSAVSQKALAPAQSTNVVSAKATKTEIKPEAEPKPKGQVASQQGNANKTAKKGSDAGRKRDGSSKATQNRVASAKQGDAAADNYKGLVLRKISRTRRKSVNIRGTAVVRFQIADSGSLASLSISRSSGSKRLDQVALAQIRTAAPFPPPPFGARRNYTIEIVGQ